MKKIYSYNKPLFTNNERKMHNIPMHRKLNKHKRNYTRCEAIETIDELLRYFNNGE